MNALLDRGLIQELYRASQAGVEIDLIVRGMCALRPGIRGVSNRIRVRSIVGRFLEHSRIYYFGNGGDEEVYLGSADLMERNLDKRVEALFPIEDPVLRNAIRTEVLERELEDTVNSSILQPDGRYSHVRPEPGEPPFDCQAWFISHPILTPELENPLYSNQQVHPDSATTTKL